MFEFVVERIEGKRINNGVTEYFLKWKDYPSEQNTWEPVEHLNCPDIIAAYEESEKIKACAKKNKPLEIDTTRDFANKRVSKKKAIFGFQRGLIPAKILGATDSSGELMFLMSWKNSNTVELVPAKLANVNCPQVVINFYEDRLIWNDEIEAKDQSSKAGKENNKKIDLTEDGC